ncbi:serine hydrolase [Rapidithrix thailandica]|uniref:Serine hydrolase n=1 Tax=Rapidithrix thailandica TaxID=413964 RepID=A0AAW9S995_9BACT
MKITISYCLYSILLPLISLAQPQLTTEPGTYDNTSQVEELKHRKHIERQLTLLKNEGEVIPIRQVSTPALATVSIGEKNLTPFQQGITRYTACPHFNLDFENSPAKLAQLETQLQPFSTVIIGIHQFIPLGSSTALGTSTQEFIKQLMKQHTVIVAFFRPAAELKRYAFLANAQALLLAHQDDPTTGDLAGQLLFGGIGAKGKLEFAIDDLFQVNDGLVTQGGFRLKYTLPEELHIHSALLSHRIDSVVRLGLTEKAFPGCQVLAAKNGKVFFQKSYGYHTYQYQNKVKDDDVYDLASVTKVTAATLALMKMVEEGKIDLDAPFSTYWKDFKKKEKANFTVREVLAHYARLHPYIVYWQQAVRKNGKFKCHTFKTDSNKRYNARVSKDLYMHRKFRKKVYKAIRQSPLNPGKEYVYSGLSFLLYPEIIKHLTGQNFDQFLQTQFYQPLGASNLTFNPYETLPAQRIVPTEYDSLFRKGQIHGFVHDEAAAVMGGISGNAGLFSNANDLAKVLQMWLQNGTYAGTRYLKEATVKEFTRCQYCEEGNRRGLGFDKPLLEHKERGSVAVSASMQSFGHTGFTGTLIWADPSKDLVFIFLSNRVYPTRENKKLYSLNIRPAIHEILYQLQDSYQASSKD